MNARTDTTLIPARELPVSGFIVDGRNVAREILAIEATEDGRLDFTCRGVRYFGPPIHFVIAPDVLVDGGTSYRALVAA